METRNNYKIGLILGRIEETYQAMVWPAISRYACNQNCELYIFTGNSMGEIGEYCLNYDNLKHFISSSCLDGLIIMTGAMGDYYSHEEIIDYCNLFHPIPMVTIALEVPGIPCVMIDNKTGVKEVVAHFINDHSFEKIAFIKGPDFHEEATERFCAYKEVLQEYNIACDPALIASGNFSKQAGMDAVELFLDKHGVTPEAIVAVDDDTALGALIALQERKIHSIKVAGFDNTDEAQLFMPSLTTVNQPLIKQGEKALEILLQLMKHNDRPGNTYLPTEMIIRQSCGCQPEAIRAFSSEKKDRISLSPEAMSIFTIAQSELPIEKKINNILEELKQIALLTHDKAAIITVLNDILISLHEYTISEITDANQQFEMEHIILKAKIFVTEIEKSISAVNKSEEKYKIWLLRQVGHTLISNFELDELLVTIEKGLHLLRITSCYICSYKQKKEKLSEIPEKSTLVFALQNKQLLDINKINRAFPTNELLPDVIKRNIDFNTHIVMPLYFKEEQFGYIIFALSSGNTSVYESLRGYISSAIKGANIFYERRKAEKKLITTLAKLEIANKQLQDLSITDELTGLYNRRGFNSFGKKEFEISKKLNKTFLIFFFDLDGLKVINDTYGHKEGDYIIKSAAELLFRTFRQIDIVCRLGGDEFVAMVLEATTRQSENIIRRFHELLDEFNEIIKKPYTLSISYGFIEFNSKVTYSFEELIEMADKKQYKNKQAKKKARE